MSFLTGNPLQSTTAKTCSPNIWQVYVQKLFQAIALGRGYVEVRGLLYQASCFLGKRHAMISPIYLILILLINQYLFCLLTQFQVYNRPQVCLRQEQTKCGLPAHQQIGYALNFYSRRTNKVQSRQEESLGFGYGLLSQDSCLLPATEQHYELHLHQKQQKSYLFSPNRRPTIVGPQQMNLPEDLLRLLFGMAALIPLSYPMRHLSASIRYWYSFIISSLLQIYVFRESMYPIYIQHVIVFGIIKLKGPKCGLLVTAESMLFLSGYQIHQILTNYGGWTMNASALLMILVCKYSLLAYNLQDGAIRDQKLVAALTEEQKRYRITSAHISFADFTGYCNFLPTSLVGPPIEYQDYKQFMDGQAVYASLPSAGLHKMLLRTLGQTFLCAAIYGFSQAFCPVSRMRSQELYRDNGFWYVFFYAFFSTSLARFKYYFGWKLSMSGIHASGVSYNGSDFSRINSVNIIEVETSIHIRQKISNWNIHVQKWLSRCIYQRHDFKSRSKNQLFVFVISAFWHGFYGAYYITFSLWFIQLYLQGIIFNYCKDQSVPLVQLYKKSGRLGASLLSLLAQLLFSHNGAFFLILHSHSCWNLFLKLHFAPIVVMVVLIVAFNLVKAPRAAKVKPVANQENRKDK